MIYLCRHGQTAWTLSGQHTSTTDLPLTPTGKDQAATMLEPLSNIKKAFSSPLIRATQTATLAAFSPEVDADLTEWNYGDYEGLTSQQIKAKNPNWNLFTDGAPNGESPEQVTARADRFLKRLSRSEPLAIFSHGHFSRVLAARYLGLDISKAQILFLSVASISILGQEHSRPVIRLWNSTAHLNT
jgi:broad specificity phosphatase PhoE